MAMKKCRLKGFLFVLIVALFASNNYAAEKLALEFKPKRGEKHVVRLTEGNKISHTIGGQQQNINHMKVTGLEFEVMEVDANGISLIKVTYKNLREKTVTAADNFEYDSTKPATAENDSFATMYTAMMGQSFMVSVTPRGEVVELKGLDDFFSQMAEKMTVAEDEFISKAPVGTCPMNTVVRKEWAAMSAEERAKIRIEKLNARYGSREKRKEGLKEQIKNFPTTNEAQITKMVRNVITDFTGRPVEIGDSWEAKVIPPYAPLSEIGATYTLKGNDEVVVSVDVNSKIDLDETAFGSAGNGPKAKVEMTGRYHGTLQIDKTNGWMISKKVEMKLSGQVTQQAMTVPTLIESSVTVEPADI